MIGIVGLLGVSAIISAVVAVIGTAVSIGLGADAAIKQKEALNKQEDMQDKQHAVEKFHRNRAQMKSRRAAAAGTLASIIETKKTKYKTDATYRKLTQMQSSKSVIGHARVNRSNYNYGSPAQS